MEVVTKPVGSDYEENLILFPIALVHAPIACLDAVRLYLVAGLVDVVHQNSRALLAGVAAIDRKPNFYLDQSVEIQRLSHDGDPSVICPICLVVQIR